MMDSSPINDKSVAEAADSKSDSASTANDYDSNAPTKLNNAMIPPTAPSSLLQNNNTALSEGHESMNIDSSGNSLNEKVANLYYAPSETLQGVPNDKVNNTVVNRTASPPLPQDDANNVSGGYKSVISDADAPDFKDLDTGVSLLISCVMSLFKVITMYEIIYNTHPLYNHPIPIVCSILLYNRISSSQTVPILKPL